MASNVNVNGANTPSNSGNKNNPPKSRLCCFGYVDYIVLASTLAIALGDELDVNDLNILSTFFAVLSDELALISTVQSCHSNNGGEEEVFTPPVPDVAITTTDNKTKKSAPRKKTRIKKIIRKKVKKK